MMPAARVVMRRGSRDDMILADPLVFLGAISCILPSLLAVLLFAAGQAATRPMKEILHDDVRF